ncbi:ParB/RepB/Spo0J family partition protein [Algivirga pacifica]|uniref:ParB/RepB/Spo0J family partition protein n=1 Tax=Algivirga pacifica TaxID=1162670 RepID=A0ABP9D3P3_9BACT
MSDKKTLKKRTSLGKGLGALLGDTPPQGASTAGSTSRKEETLNEILVSAVETNPYQPRLEFDQEALKELSDSIRVQGIIQPITVRKMADNHYQLISGERRLQASKLAGLERIPAYIRTATDVQMLEMALIENIQREDLNPVEVALSYQRLISECELKQEELGDRVGKKRSTVTNYLRLLKLPPQIQDGLKHKEISMGHARALVNVENIDVQLAIFEKIVKDQLSVRKTEAMVRDIIQGKGVATEKKEASEKRKALSYELSKLQHSLSSHFGAQVKINSADDDKGEIKIPFHSVEDLNRILELLKYE